MIQNIELHTPKAVAYHFLLYSWAFDAKSSVSKNPSQRGRTPYNGSKIIPRHPRVPVSLGEVLAGCPHELVGLAAAAGNPVAGGMRVEAFL